MKVLPFRIRKTGDPAILIQVDKGNCFYDKFHKHTEHQITLIVKGEGTVICSEHLGRFTAGDVLFFGSNQPHVLKCDEDYFHKEMSPRAHAVSLFFNTDALGHQFMGLNETEGLQKFLRTAHRGMKFSRRVATEAYEPILGCVGKSDLLLIIEFLKILSILMKDKEMGWFESELTSSMDEDEGQRMNAVVQYTLEHFRERIGIDDIASVANMTPNAFCRYFKLRTRKTYLNYLNEIRIAHACNQLKKNGLSVSQVAHLSGFINLSHFNRSFKKVTGVTPGRYARVLK